MQDRLYKNLMWGYGFINVVQISLAWILGVEEILFEYSTSQSLVLNGTDCYIAVLAVYTIVLAWK